MHCHSIACWQVNAGELNADGDGDYDAYGNDSVILLSISLLKPWLHVKIKLFWRILVFYFNMEPRLKWNKIILAAKIILFHCRCHVWNAIKLF